MPRYTVTAPGAVRVGAGVDPIKVATQVVDHLTNQGGTLFIRDEGTNTLEAKARGGHLTLRRHPTRDTDPSWFDQMSDLLTRYWRTP